MVFGGQAMIKIVKNTEEVIDFVCELSQSDLHASYPRRTTMKDVKYVIERAISSENREIVAFYEQDVLCGVCIYYWICEDNYAQTEVFLIKENYERIAEEFIEHIGKHLPGFALLVGVPVSNKSANEYFKIKNIECVSSSIDTRLFVLKEQMHQKHDKIERITKDDFGKYAIFHDKFAAPLEMYYDSKNLLKEIDRFRVFAFRESEEIHGTIFIKILKDCEFEVFGLFVDREYENKGIYTSLINEMFLQLYNEFREVKEIVYFIEEDCTEELNSALCAGFKIKDQYRCYKCKL